MLSVVAADTYDRLIALLDQHGASYRLIDHAPEGSTEAVSGIRGGNRVA
jgi:Ala-tRNA(Pro) deacylase